MCKYLYSLDWDNFECAEGETIDEVVKEIIENETIVRSVIIGEAIPYTESGEDFFDDIIEQAMQNAYQIGVDFDKGYLEDIKPEAKEYLRTELNRIWNKFKEIQNEPTPYYHLGKYGSYKINPDGSYRKIATIR